jgi:hypothetical protein
MMPMTVLIMKRMRYTKLRRDALFILAVLAFNFPIHALAKAGPVKDAAEPQAEQVVEEDDEVCDVLHSYWNAASHRAKTFEVERMTSDMLGASPFETNHPEFHL